MNRIQRAITIALSVTAIGAASPAAAQSSVWPEGAAPPQPQNGSIPVEERDKTVLLRRYFDAIRIESLMRRTMEDVAQGLEAKSQIPAEDRFAIQGAFDGAVEALTPALLADFTELYAEAFTVEELQGLVGFYESPVGRSLMIKTERLTGDAAALMFRHGPAFERDFSRRYRAIAAQGAPAS